MRNVYIGLLRNGREIRGKGYKRRSLVKMSWAVGVVAGVVTFQNQRQIRFPAARRDWGLITEFGLFTGKKCGRLLVVVPLVKAKHVDRRSVASIKPGNLDMGMMEGWH